MVRETGKLVGTDESGDSTLEGIGETTKGVLALDCCRELCGVDSETGIILSNDRSGSNMRACACSGFVVSASWASSACLRVVALDVCARVRGPV